MNAQPKPAEHADFAAVLLLWYDQHARALPWREDRDPYRVWLSEIMLQQTRVAAAVEHYRKFLKKFPEVRKLARAREASVLAAWSGLGYYRRARMLHAAANVVVKEYGGEFPRTAEGLRALPGIGRYTAAAIASIAFDEPMAVVDGNVERVLARLNGRRIDGEELWQAAQRLLESAAGEPFASRRLQPGNDGIGRDGMRARATEMFAVSGGAYVRDPRRTSGFVDEGEAEKARCRIRTRTPRTASVARAARQP